MTDDKKQRLREAGRELGAALPPVNPEVYRHIADLMREPINAYISGQRRGAGAA